MSNKLLTEQELKNDIAVQVLEAMAQSKYGLSYLLLDDREKRHLHADVGDSCIKILALIQSQKLANLEQQIAEATQLIHGRHSIECDKCYDDLGLTKDNNKEK